MFCCYLELADDRLENLFGNMRQQCRSMKNFDVIQLSERIVSARQVDEVFAQRPEWDAGSRKRMNSLDHHNPVSWTGDTSLASVDLFQCWKDGEVSATEVLTRDALFSNRACDFVGMENRTVSQRITMLKPRGMRIGVFPGTRRTACGVDNESSSDSDGGDDDGSDDDDFDEPDRHRPRKKETTEELQLVGKLYQDESNKKVYRVMEVAYSSNYREIVAFRQAVDVGHHNHRIGRYDLEGYDLEYTRARIAKWDPTLADAVEDEDAEDAEASEFDMDMPDVEIADRHNKHEPKVKMENGDMVLKSHALRLKFAANKKATDRVRRSMGMAKTRSDPSQQTQLDAAPDIGSIRSNMVLACVVQIGSSAVMVICRVDQCNPGNADEIAAEHLDDEEYSITGRALLLRHRDGRLVWKSGRYLQPKIKKISVRNLIQIKPSSVQVMYDQTGRLEGMEYKFGGELDEAFDALDPGKWKEGSLAKLQSAGNMPYKNGDGDLMFVYGEAGKARKRKRKRTKSCQGKAKGRK